VPEENPFIDLDLEFLPDEADELSPEDEMAALEALGDPDDLPLPPADEDEDTLPFGRTVFMDFDTKTVYPDRWVRGADSVVQVLQMALHSTRGEHLVFPDWFGRTAPDELLGYVDETERRALYAADIKETLIAAHERVTDVTDITWTVDSNGTAIDFEATVEIDGIESIVVEAEA
jgi:hypothetical protein